MPVNPEKTVRTSVIVPAETYAAVQAIAEANQVSTAWIIRRAVMRFLDEYKGRDPLVGGPRDSQR